MSLNYDASKVTGWDKISSSNKEAVCFATMSIGIGEITEATLDEWLDRAKIREAWYGAALFKHDDPMKRCLLGDREWMSQFLDCGPTRRLSSLCRAGSSFSMTTYA